MPRKYQKKNSSYWNSLSAKPLAEVYQEQKIPQISPNIDLELIGEPIISFASQSRSGDRVATRKNGQATNPVKDRFKNIDEGLLPFQTSNDSVGVTDAVLLTQKAYFNVPVFKSTIDLLSEFTDTDIYLQGGNESSKEFVMAWFKKIKLYDLKEQFFREFYRSGNVMLYELNAKLKTKTIKSFVMSNSAINARVPIKYIVLNPSSIVVRGQLDFGEFTYAKVLTPFEIARMKKPLTPHEKELVSSLPEDVRRKVNGKNGIGVDEEIMLELDPNILHPVFYKKQDYEPLSVPMGFAVLDDINKKLELKKIDQAIARSVENVILLITMGTEPDKGGINSNNIKAMQDIFKNQSVGRVLVSDYTTKADFIIPDLKKVMGKEKYEVLNKDIEEGLANVLLGESKYADTELKLKIFFQRLEEARGRFLNDFLQKEIDRVCKDVGFKSAPKAVFKKIDTINNTDLQRLITRMVEIGVLTPEQGMEVIDKGVFPKAEELGSKQQRYVDERKKGFYQPIIGGQAIMEAEDGILETKEVLVGPSQTKKKKSATVSAPSGGRPTGTGGPKSKASLYSTAAILAITDFVNQFYSKAESSYKKKLNLKKLTEDQKKTIRDICVAIVVGEEKENWEYSLARIIENFKHLLELNVNDGVLSIASEHGLDDYSAALIYHSTKIQPLLENAES